jgi:hypothetical protein
MRISLPQIAAAHSNGQPIGQPVAQPVAGPDARFEKKEKCAVFGIWAMPPKPVALGPGSSAGPSPVRELLADGLGLLPSSIAGGVHRDLISGGRASRHDGHGARARSL